jgi:Ca2+-transporting ATPase
MFNAMNAISDEASLVTMPPHKNKWLILALFSSITLHCVILYIPFFNNIFSIMPLDAKEWILVLVFSIPVVFLDELVKIYTRFTSNKNKKLKIE